MTVPEGFEVKLFAGEPDVQQPIAMCLDDRGRLWVAEAYSYPIRATRRKAKDRILIFEDTDGDGNFDKRTVFMEGLNLVSGLEVGFGGVWIGAAPYLMFIPDQRRRGQAGRPAADPARRLGAIKTRTRRSTPSPGAPTAGSMAATASSPIRASANPVRPMTSARRSTPASGAIIRPGMSSRSSPQGTSNPWGLDFNEYGQAFVEACVIPHCFHIIQGGRYQRQAGEHFNPYTYADIQTIADHRHYLGANPHGGNGRSDSAGGGHAHSGAMIYLGGAWPEEYWGETVHGQHPRPAASMSISSEAQGLRLCRASRQARFPPGQRRLGPVHQFSLRSRRECICHRLVRHAIMPSPTNRTSGTAATAAFTRFPTAG